MTEQAREIYRQSLIVKYPRFYNPWIQLFLPTIVGLIVATHLLMSVTKYTFFDIFYVLFLLIVVNGVEYFVHKELFHNVVPGLKFLYSRHVSEHHLVFKSDSMGLRSINEIRLVMVPLRTLWLLAGLLGLIYFVFFSLHLTNYGALFVAVAVLYTIVYEWLHLLYHLPASGVKGSILNKLAKHHTIHHDIKRMKNYNFNVTLPLWDYIIGTVSK